MADKNPTNKDKEIKIKAGSSVVEDKKNGKKDEKNKNKATDQSKNDNSEILGILKVMQGEQKKATAQVEDLTKRISDMEAYASQPWEEDLYDGESRDDGEDGEIRDPETHHVSPTEDKFASLSKRFKSSEACGVEIDERLASHVTDLFRQGMDEIQYEHLSKDEVTPRPSNCEGLQSVRMNRPIWDVISRASQTTDNKLQRCSNSVLKASVILTNTVDKLAKIDKEDLEVSDVIESVNDALALLGHSHHQNAMIRRDLVRPELKKEYNVLCNHSNPYTGFLFGEDVAKSVKDIEETSRMGLKVQNFPPRRYSPGGQGGFARGRARFQPYQAPAAGFRGGYRPSRGRGYQFPGGARGDGPKNFPQRGGARPPRR